MPNSIKKPGKSEEEENLIRQPHGDLAEYKRDTYVSPSISRFAGAKTLVPRGGEIDQALKSKTETPEAGAPDQGNAKYMADGGFVTDDDPQLMDTLTKGTSEQAAPTQPQIPPPPQPIAAPPPPSLAPAAPPAASPAAPARPLPGMPPSITPDEISNYLGQQKQALNKFGPEQQMELQQALDQRRNSLGYKLTDAGKGFADAIMQGVARAGSPGFQQQFEGQENEAAKQRMDTMRGAQEGNLKRVEAGMSLDKMDPNSVESKTAQSAYAPLFQKLGYPTSALGKMSAADISSALSLMSEYGGKQLEAQIKAYELAIEGKRTEAALANVQSESANRIAQQKLEREKMKVEHPFASLLSGTTEAAPTGGAAVGPYGATTTRNGKTYEWSPVTKQYHPVNQ